jgi:hypothetical protein
VGGTYRRRMLPSLRNWTAFRMTSRTVSNISSSIPDQQSYGQEERDVPLAPSEHGHMKTSIKVKEQNATSNKSRTFNIVMGYFCSSAWTLFPRCTPAYFTVSNPSSRHLHYHHPIDNYLQYMPNLRWAYTLVYIIRSASRVTTYA